MLDAKQLLDNESGPWFHLFELQIDRRTAASWFSAAPTVAWVDGLGNADYWAVEFPCGLGVALEFIHWGTTGTVFATEPVCQHVERHLKHWQSHLCAYPPEAFERERAYCIERFTPEFPGLLELQSFQAWRQGDDGNYVLVGTPTSKRDADCWVAELESHQHKQIYGVDRVT